MIRGQHIFWGLIVSKARHRVRRNELQPVSQLCPRFPGLPHRTTGWRRWLQQIWISPVAGRRPNPTRSARHHSHELAHFHARDADFRIHRTRPAPIYCMFVQLIKAQCLDLGSTSSPDTSNSTHEPGVTTTRTRACPGRLGWGRTARKPLS